MGGRFKREGTYIYTHLWLIRVDIWQKPTQHCKVIILQLKINFKKRKTVCSLKYTGEPILKALPFQGLTRPHLHTGKYWRGLPGGTSGKESTCQCRRCKRPGFSPWVGKTPLELEMAAHSNILAWEILWTEEPGGL